MKYSVHVMYKKYINNPYKCKSVLIVKLVLTYKIQDCFKFTFRYFVANMKRH